MKKYGLKIGSTGLEFVSIDDRDKALKNFTRGVDVQIHSSGIKYTDGDGAFSVYERDTKEVLVTCCICRALQGIDSCPHRSYPYKSYTGKYDVNSGHICDACLIVKEKEKAIFDAQQVLKEVKEEED